MNVEKAIKLLQTGMSIPNFRHSYEEAGEACKMAIEALKTQQKTAVKALKELREELNEVGTIDMETVDDLIEKVKSELIQFENTVEDSNKYEQVMNQLGQGKKLKVNLFYSYPWTPSIRITGYDGVKDEFELECVSTTSKDTYEIEKPIRLVDTVEVLGYTRDVVPIQYIYIKSDCLFAHLINGEDVEYALNIMDLNAVIGEYKEPSKNTRVYGNFMKKFLKVN